MNMKFLFLVLFSRVGVSGNTMSEFMLNPGERILRNLHDVKVKTTHLHVVKFFTLQALTLKICMYFFYLFFLKGDLHIRERFLYFCIIFKTSKIYTE